jgi:ABC-type glycerol-3-phosphate transport system permease component
MDSPRVPAPEIGTLLKRRGVAPLSGRRLAEAVLVVSTHALLALGVVATITPFVWMFLSSFKTNPEIFSFPITILPRQPTLENYLRLMRGDELPFVRQFANSLVIALGQTVLVLFVASAAGFAFAKYEFPLKRLLFIVVLATLTIPLEVTLVPLFIIVSRLGMLDTFWGVILPGAVNAFAVFFMRQVMLGIPSELLDASRIDGCSEFGIYSRVALPLSRGGLAVLAILVFLNSWNDYLWPIIVLRSTEMFTLPVGLATLVGLYKVEYGMIMAGAFLATLPIILLFLVARHHLVEGITSGALKA